jgi:hypothetical protein
MLNRTSCFDGLMKSFRHAYRHFAAPGKMVTTDQFARLFSNIRLTDSDFDPQTFVPEPPGAVVLSRALLAQAGIVSSGR